MLLKGFSHKWDAVHTEPTITDDNYYKPRKWQEDGFYLIGERKRIINCPMGAGKSMFTKYIATQDMLNNPKEKTVIAVPQTQIADGFRGGGLQFSDGTRVDWSIDNQSDLMSLEGKVSNRAMTDRFVDFLQGKTVPGHLPSRVLLCSHATLVNVYKRLKRKNQLNLFGNVSVFIDEAHHVKNAQFEVEGDEELWLEQNELGKFVEFLCEKKNSRLTLITATFFRGDRLGILPDKWAKKFVKCDLPFDEYFKHMKHLRSFSFDFLVYKACPTEAIKELFDKKIGKTIIHIPHVTSKFSTGDKNKEVDRIIKSISDGRAKKEIDSIGNIIVKPKKKKKKIVVVDLVEDGPLREKRKKYIDQHSKSKSGPDVIIALGMFKEGANYDYADRSIIIGAKNSLTEMVQIVGRLFRDAEGKKHVSVYQLLPQTFDNEDSEEFKEYLNDFLKAILSSMLLEDVLTPNFARNRQAREERETEPRGEREHPFDDLFDDDAKRVETLRKIVEKAIGNRAENGEENQRDNFNKIVDAVLKNEGIAGYDLDAVAGHVWNMLSARTMQMDGIDVSEIDMDLIKEADPLGWVLRYTSALCNIDTFDSLRTWFNDRKTPEEWVMVAEKLAEENGGNLQNVYWLQNNGYGALCICMNKYPDLFVHIEQEDKGGKEPEEWVPIAEELAKENGGKLQGHGWLQKNGYNALSLIMYRHPDLFAHIEQESKRKTPEEWVMVAEKLAKENGGKLPLFSWLKKNGYVSLDSAQNRHPDLFAHIEQEDNGRKTPEEWVQIAEELAKENGGKLPSSTWLKKNGYLGLDALKPRRPDLFAHIEQESKRKTPEEWVMVAEELAKENGGKLHTHQWLTDNGHSGLSAMIYKHPDLFAHIEQESKIQRKTPEEWVPIAEELAKENGGKLQGRGWLQKNGYNALSLIMYRHPDLFAHIERELFVSSKKSRNWPSFEEAKKIMKGFKLKNARDWREWCKSGQRPNNIPSAPDKVYKDDWKDWKDWLGN